jgi:putative transposase
MARIARMVVPGLPHHVTQRGARRQRTFFSDADYGHYLDLLGNFLLKTDTSMWAYCLMPNHVHLVLVPSHADGLRALLGEVHRRYTRAINLREGWRGHLWQERFYSAVLDERHTIAAVHYVEHNPVVAGLCDVPAQWPWSSAFARAAGDCSKGIILKSPLWVVNAYHAFPPHQLVAEQDNLRRHTRTGRPLGPPEFLEGIERKTGISLARGKPGRPRGG